MKRKLLFIPLMVLPLLAWSQSQTPFDSLQILRSEIILFDFGKFDIRAEADSLAQKLATEFSDREDIRIHLTAHTDAIGTNDANDVLSQNRAEAVLALLNEKGITDSLMLIETFGENDPVADNESDEGRQQNRRVTIDIYRQTPMLYLEGLVKDKETGKGIEANVIIRSKEFRDSLRTDEEGRFRHPVPDNTVIGLDIYAKGYFFDSQMLRTNANKMPTVDVELPPAKEGEAVDLKNLYFVGNKAVLLKRSQPELAKVLKFTQINPDIKIEIAGHINYPNRPVVGEETWHHQLSVDRAKLVYDFLMKNGASPDMVVYKGYGNSQMRYPNAYSEKEQELNRRVEIRILATGENIGKLGKDGY